jgi:hypothetical protein
MGPWYGEWCIPTATSWNTGRGNEVEGFDQFLQVKWWVSEDGRLGRESFRRPSDRARPVLFQPFDVSDS